MSKDHKALEDADACIKLQPEWPKGWYRKGCVLRELLRDDEALEVLQKAITLAPKDPEIRAKFAEVKLRGTCFHFAHMLLALSRVTDLPHISFPERGGKTVRKYGGAKTTGARRDLR